MVRRDLLPGQILAQTVHAAFNFSQDYPLLTENWMNISNYICILEIDNEHELVKLYQEVKNKNISSSCYIEPDLNKSMTAIALAPCPQSKKVCSKLKLALK